MPCPLCEYTGSDHPLLHEILSHVTDNAHQVHIAELCVQIQPMLREKLDINMELTELQEHFHGSVLPPTRHLDDYLPVCGV